MNPSFGLVDISDFSPIFKLCNDLDGEVSLMENPIYRVTDPGAGTDINFFGTQRNKTRERKFVVGGMKRGAP